MMEYKFIHFLFIISDIKHTGAFSYQNGHIFIAYWQSSLIIDFQLIIENAIGLATFNRENILILMILQWIKTLFVFKKNCLIRRF